MKDAERAAEDAEAKPMRPQTEWCACEEGNRGDDGDDGDPGPEPEPEPEPEAALDDYPAPSRATGTSPTGRGTSSRDRAAPQQAKGAPNCPTIILS